MTSSSESVAKIAELVKGIRIAMLTTIDGDKHLTARPMAAQEVEFDGDMWFFVETESPTVRNLTADPSAGVALSSNDTWVSLSGTAEVVHDEAKSHELWNQWAEAWLPQGPDDPSVTLLKFHAETGEYWESPGKIAGAVGFVKAKLTGGQIEGGESETVQLG